eukprot:3208343-Amphidinium_carterae.1
MYGRFDRSKSAWNETSQHQNGVLLASCVAALLYNNTQSLTCAVTSDHLRLHFVATNPGEALFVVGLHTCILESAACFYCRHVTWGQPAKESIASTQPVRWQRLLALTRSTVDRSWSLACVLTAAPGVVYSTLKAVSQTEALQYMKASTRASSNGVNPGRPSGHTR